MRNKTTVADLIELLKFMPHTILAAMCVSAKGAE